MDLQQAPELRHPFVGAGLAEASHELRQLAEVPKEAALQDTGMSILFITLQAITKLVITL